MSTKGSTVIQREKLLVHRKFSFVFEASNEENDLNVT